MKSSTSKRCELIEMEVSFLKAKWWTLELYKPSLLGCFHQLLNVSILNQTLLHIVTILQWGTILQSMEHMVTILWMRHMVKILQWGTWSLRNHATYTNDLILFNKIHFIFYHLYFHRGVCYLWFAAWCNSDFSIARDFTPCTNLQFGYFKNRSGSDSRDFDCTA